MATRQSVKGNLNMVKGNLNMVKGYLNMVKGNLNMVKAVGLNFVMAGNLFMCLNVFLNCRGTRTPGHQTSRLSHSSEELTFSFTDTAHAHTHAHMYTHAHAHT